MIVDTHALLWLSERTSEVPAHARAVVDDERHEVFVSIVSAWELAIKVSLGKLVVEPTVQDFMQRALSSGRIRLLPISLEHVHCVQSLPRHHRDPFDRMLIAQAMVENASVVSADAAIDQYGVQRVW